MPIALVLDTSVLRQEGLASRNAHLLSRLASSDEVDLYVPEIAAREFKSQRVLEVLSQVEKIQGAIGEMSRQVDAKGQTQGELAAIKARILELGTMAVKEVETDFSMWMKSSSANLIAFDPAVMGGVLDDYFLGVGAFRKPKERDDIPDALISAGVRALLGKYERVHIALKDGALKRHLRAEPKYTLVDALSEFFTLQHVATVIAALDAKERDVEALKTLFGSGAIQASLTAYLRSATDLLEGVYVEEGNLSGTEVLGIDVYGPTLNYAQARAIEGVEFGEVSYVDQGNFSVEVAIHTKARIDFGADFADFQGLPETRAIEEWSMDGDGVCDLREVRDVALKGYLELTFDPALAPEAVEAHMQYLSVADPKILVGLEVFQASIS